MKLVKRILSTASLFLIGGTALGIPTDAQADTSHHQIREIEVVVRGGYQPNRIQIVEGEHVQLKFVRKESGSCTREVVFPTLGIRKELPEGKPVVIHLPQLEPGEYEFKCGMNMIKGKIVVRAADLSPAVRIRCDVRTGANHDYAYPGSAPSRWLATVCGQRSRSPR